MKSLFIDSNVFIKHLEGDAEAKQVLERAMTRDTTAYINDIVASEVLYVYILAVTGRRAYELKENPDELESVDLSPVRKLLGIAAILPTTAEIIEDAYEIIHQYKMLPNDAIIAATCKHYGIKTIATFDKDFKKIPWLNIIP